jgi:AhpD family alkylhydroperoxidase
MRGCDDSRIILSYAGIPPLIKESVMPKTLEDFKKQFAKTWTAYEQLRNASDKEGPLDARTAELIKIGISAALQHEGGIVAHISQARKAGASNAEIYQAILLATGLAGFPAVLAGVATAKKYLGA